MKEYIPLFRSLSEEECMEIYGFNKEDMEKLYNDGKSLDYAFVSNPEREKK